MSPLLVRAGCVVVAKQHTSMVHLAIFEQQKRRYNWIPFWFLLEYTGLLEYPAQRLALYHAQGDHARLQVFSVTN